MQDWPSASSSSSVVNWYIFLGLAIMIVSEAATVAGIEPFASWNTPIAWTGFIIFADAVVYRARGNSWMRSSPREFAALCLMSIPLWLVFESFNLWLRNWHYVGLPENPALRYFGYAWSFATIWPAIFEGAELVAVWRGSNANLKVSTPTGVVPTFTPADWASMIGGALMLVVPLLWPSRYLAAPVWLGFIFLLDPINARLGAESLAADLRSGRADRSIARPRDAASCSS